MPAKTKVTAETSPAAPAFDLAALATDDSALQIVESFGSNAGRTAEPSPFRPHVKQSYDKGQAYGFNVPNENVKETMNALRRAARQLGLGIGFDNMEHDANNSKSPAAGTTNVRFKAKVKNEQRRRSDAEKIAVVDWARANGRMVQVAGVKVNDDGTVEGKISSNIYSAYDKAQEKINANATA
jgi:hypothetical protein